MPSFVEIGSPDPEKKIFKGILNINGHGGQLGHVTWIIYEHIGSHFFCSGFQCYSAHRDLHRRAVVCSNIMSHLDEHKLLSDRQLAFRKSETQLATLIDDWTKFSDNQGQFDDTFILDFEKKKSSGYRYGTVPLVGLKVRYRIFSHSAGYG